MPPATIDPSTSKADPSLDLLTLREVGAILRLSLEAMRHRTDTRQIPFYRVGPGPTGQIRIRRCDLEKYIAKGHVPAKEPVKPVKPARRRA